MKIVTIRLVKYDKKCKEIKNAMLSKKLRKTETTSLEKL